MIAAVFAAVMASMVPGLIGNYLLMALVSPPLVPFLAQFTRDAISFAFQPVYSLLSVTEMLSLMAIVIILPFTLISVVYVMVVCSLVLMMTMVSCQRRTTS
ncbi:MAG: hypothetical protein B6I36_01335 [Desulfobacteraceae bacterium 4572_35.1]|nr:MAG: hypothetical protein B6I36_01335 [Desulfobacteraceae bacterium 4572_35.1]